MAHVLDAQHLARLRRSPMRFNNLFILVASLWHLIWGSVLGLYGGLFPGGYIRFTNSAVLEALIRNYHWRAGMLVLFALVPLFTTFWPRRPEGVIRFLSLLPQQALLLMSLGAAVSAVVAQHFADGIPRPWQFIFLDQLPSMLLSIAYTVAVLEPAMRLLFARKRAGV